MGNVRIVTGVLVLLLIFLANPLRWWMPTELQYVVVAAFATVAALFVGLVMGERARDEREIELRAKRDRAGYLAGTGVLIVAAAITVLMGEEVSVWLLVTLGVMVLARVCVHVLDK